MDSGPASESGVVIIFIKRIVCMRVSTHPSRYRELRRSPAASFAITAIGARSVGVAPEIFAIPQKY